MIGMDLEQYIKGTVAAEMPASFDIEALRAQAVCARTYAIKKLIEGSNYPQGADLSDDINSCQAYVALEDFAITASSSGRKEMLQRVEEAVDSTRGEIMLYDSRPIDALYCSTCGGQTESAGAVWGRDLPYLRSIKCNDCKESNHYKNTITINNEVISKLVGSKGDILNIKILTKTPGGRPKSVNINGHKVDTVTIRKELQLDSNWIEFIPSAHTTDLKIRGYGHGVGLCQYGANGMAARGKNYQQILKRYYTGITLYKIGY